MFINEIMFFPVHTDAFYKTSVLRPHLTTKNSWKISVFVYLTYLQEYWRTYTKNGYKFSLAKCGKEEHFSSDSLHLEAAKQTKNKKEYI